MPCFDPPRDDEVKIAEDNFHMRKGADLLCAMLRDMEAITGSVEWMPPRIQKWWEEHKERDAR